MNKVLERQLKKVFGSVEEAPKDLNDFFKLVSDTYDHFKDDKEMVERSLEISSKELGEVNKKIIEESDKLKVNFLETERLNKLMVDRELKMIELKKEIATLKNKYEQDVKKVV